MVSWKKNRDERPHATSIYEIDGYFSTNYFLASDFIDKNDIVLDSGCGAGYGSAWLSELICKNVIGVDYEKAVIVENEKQFQKNGLKFIAINDIVMPFNDNHFDVVISFEVIEHILDYPSYLTELRRVLKPNGKLIISTPNKKFFSPGMDNPVILSHEKEFYPEEFLKLLNNYFNRNILYGKFFTQSGEEKYQNAIHSMKYKLQLTRFLAMSKLVRKCAKLIPISIRSKLSGGSESPNYYCVEDFDIQETTLNELQKKISLSIILVCDNKSPF